MASTITNHAHPALPQAGPPIEGAITTLAKITILAKITTGQTTNLATTRTQATSHPINIKLASPLALVHTRVIRVKTPTITNPTSTNPTRVKANDRTTEAQIAISTKINAPPQVVRARIKVGVPHLTTPPTRTKPIPLLHLPSWKVEHKLNKAFSNLSPSQIV